MWDSRDKAQNYRNKDWLLLEELVPCRGRNIINNLLVDRDRILFPPLHIKFGSIKQFTKDGGCFTYLKAGSFDRPLLRQLIRDPEFAKFSEQSETESLECFCFSFEELYWQQEGQGLHRTCHQYANSFQKPRMQHEHRNALLTFI